MKFCFAQELIQPDGSFQHRIRNLMQYRIEIWQMGNRQSIERLRFLFVINLGKSMVHQNQTRNKPH
jgi:hypothetical protein